MLTHPTLYKRTSAGAVQTWWMEQEGEKYRACTGQLEGAITKAEWTICEGKNLGRKNATTPETQADAGVKSAYTIKLNQGRYHERIEEIDNEKYFAPMLAHPWDKYPITDEQLASGVVLAQPKLDGVRCIATRTGLWTRKGKPLVAMPHIFEALQPIFAECPELVLDGELYHHDYRHLLNKISGICRKKKPSEEDMILAARMEYHIYDCVFPGREDALWSDRFQSLYEIDAWEGMMREIARGILPSQDVDHKLRIVPTHNVDSKGLLDVLNAEWLGQEYEGQIIRIDAAPYENKRSKFLLKRKEFIDEEFEIVEIEEGTGNRSGMAGSIVYKAPPGAHRDTFNSGIAGGEDLYRDLWANREKFIGGQGTVRYFKLTEYGIPYLPVTHVIWSGQRDL